MTAATPSEGDKSAAARWFAAQGFGKPAKEILADWKALEDGPDGYCHPLWIIMRDHRLAAIEEAAKVALNPGFIQARDDEWDTGFNDAKRIIATAIRALKEPSA